MNEHEKLFVFIRAGIFFAALVLICFSCDNESRYENFQKKYLPETHYILVDVCDSLSNINAGIAKALEIYSASPEDFSEIAGIIDEFNDKDSLTAHKRFIGLIESGNKCYAYDRFNHGIIEPGDMLVYKCFLPADSIDICWRDFRNNIEKYGYTVVPPGLEIYRGFGSDNFGDSVFVELIIGIKK